MSKEIQFAIDKLVKAHKRLIYRNDEQSALVLRATGEVVEEMYPKHYEEIRKIALIQADGIRREKIEKERKLKWNF